MNILQRVKSTNKLVELMGITFTTPYLRKAFGQYPYEIDSIKFSQKNLGKKLKKTIYKRDKPFVAIIHDNDNNQIVDVFYVPLVKAENNKMKIV